MFLHLIFDFNPWSLINFQAYLSMTPSEQGNFKSHRSVAVVKTLLCGWVWWQALVYLRDRSKTIRRSRLVSAVEWVQVQLGPQRTSQKHQHNQRLKLSLVSQAWNPSDLRDYGQGNWKLKGWLDCCVVQNQPGHTGGPYHKIKDNEMEQGQSWVAVCTPFTCVALGSSFTADKERNEICILLCVRTAHFGSVSGTSVGFLVSVYLHTDLSWNVFL